MAHRCLCYPTSICLHQTLVLFVAGVPGVKPVHIELTDFKTKEKVDELEVDAVMVATGRAPFTQVIFAFLQL